MRRKLIYAFVASIIFSGIVVSDTSAQNLRAIQSAISARGASWVAGENPISRLTPQEQKQLLGVINGPKSATQAAPTCRNATVGLSPSFDWRNNGGNYISGVRNQGGCGTCWAHAAIAALESATLIANKTPNTELNLSEQVLISCCDSTCSPSGQCSGGYLEYGADFLRDTGVPVEGCYPYQGYGKCGNACTNWQASAYKIRSWDWVVPYGDTPSVDTIKGGVVNGPLAIALVVYTDFYYYDSGVYSHVWGSKIGYHAVLLVGYDDTGQYFIAKNSWGTEWGEAGFFKIAYSEVTGDSQFGYMTQAYHVGDSPDPKCEYPTGDYFNAGGGTGGLQVAAADGCDWSAVSNASWLTITSGSSGTGSGAVLYAVAPNTTSSARNGTMTIQDKAYTVAQEQGPTECAYAISPKSNSFEASGGTGSLTVATASQCPWTATSGVSWITITSGASGSGNGTVNYSVAANSSTTARNGTMTIAGQTFTVTQAGQSCTYAITPTSNSVSAATGTGSVSVTAPAGCNWTAASNASSWVSITSGASGSGNGTVNYSVAANSSTTARNGTMTIAGQTFTVTQAGITCTYATSPTSNSFTAAAGTGSVSVTSPAGCDWTATTNAGWIDITNGSSGSGNGTVSYSVKGHSKTSQRTGTMTIAGQTFTVSQNGITCTFSISPTSNSFTAAAGTGSVSVTAPAGCDWTATSSATSWITITSGASGSDNGTVNYSIAANGSTTARTGTMTIAGQTFTVSQNGITCTFSISPTSNSFTAAAGTGSVSVTSPAGCTWTAASNASSWVSITSGASGSGNGTVNYSVGANSSSTARNGTMTIAGQTFTVAQAGQTCTYAITPSTVQAFGASGGTGSANVSTGAGCSWTASLSGSSMNGSWVTITSGASGTGSGTISYSVPANTHDYSRIMYLVVDDKAQIITQASGCTYSLGSSAQNFSASGGTGSVSVTTGATCTWTASSNASWITVTSGGSSSGNGTVNYSVAANTGVARSGTITIGDQTFSVTQAGGACTYSLSSSGQNFNASSGTGLVSVTSPAGCAWTATNGAPSWTTITSGASGTGNGTVNYSIAANTTTSQRTGILTVGGQTFTVSQAGGSSCTYSISPTSYGPFASVGGTGTVSVTSPAGCAWTATSNTSWVTVTGGSSGSGNGMVFYSVAPNTDGPQRTGTMTIGGQTLTVTESYGCSWSINPSSQSFTSAAGAGAISVYAGSGCTWQATSNASWLTVAGGSGPGNGTVSYSVAANTGAARSGTITGIGGLTHTVTQAAGSGSCAYSISPTSNSFGAAAGTGTVSVTAGSGCAWTATSNNWDWLTVTGGGSGSGNGTVSYTVMANTGTTGRTGTMYVAGLLFTVSQAGAAPSCSVSTSTASVHLTYMARQGNIPVGASSTCSWSASTNVPWISFISGATGTGNGKVTFLASTNTGAARTGTITVGSSTVTVNQDGAPGK